MPATTIKMQIETVQKLIELKIHPRETYEDVIMRLIGEHEEAKPRRRK